LKKQSNKINYIILIYTNFILSKLRIAAGLKPLNVEKEDTAEQKAQKNLKELQEEQAQKQQEQDIKDRIEKYLK
jgi:hypothetical protein